MIKLSSIIDSEPMVNGKRQVKVSVMADTSTDIVAIGKDATSVYGLGANYEMTMGSNCICLDTGKVIFLNSLGTWVEPS